MLKHKRMYFVVNAYSHARQGSVIMAAIYTFVAKVDQAVDLLEQRARVALDDGMNSFDIGCTKRPATEDDLIDRPTADSLAAQLDGAHRTTTRMIRRELITIPLRARLLQHGALPRVHLPAGNLSSPTPRESNGYRGNGAGLAR
ncbi:hypothetical protein DCS_06401 [Drechmeria coniospora]|uniref:Uncharacterized protein n=1 Tax=Drechmeria coniospora TaxID=98403 RepID=A0A151GBL1_DRECN|nr:hypothetical protein DCS_06401 [Drechmeria coniospora]KYK54443.1 hypothetical protein DCS_06401 [Drechmeria coniospora]